MKDFWSLKKVLPAVAPEMGYSQLGAVQDGGMAQAVYATLILNELLAETRESLIEDLRRYCRMDTEGLVKIVHYVTNSK